MKHLLLIIYLLTCSHNIFTSSRIIKCAHNTPNLIKLFCTCIVDFMHSSGLVRLEPCSFVRCINFSCGELELAHFSVVLCLYMCSASAYSRLTGCLLEDYYSLQEEILFWSWLLIYFCLFTRALKRAKMMFWFKC